MITVISCIYEQALKVAVPSLDLSRKDVLMTLTECEETAEDGNEVFGHRSIQGTLVRRKSPAEMHFSRCSKLIFRVYF